MKHTALFRLAAATAAMFAAPAAHSAIMITVTPWSAPNVFGSPSFDQAALNQFDALRTGASSVGTPGTPTYYQAISGPVSYGANQVTNFNSWQGIADPGAPFQDELGNRIHFGLSINGNGEQFSISQLSMVFDGDGASNYFDFDFGGGYQYSPYGTAGGGFVGILKGLDGILGTSDDIFITSGPSTQLVDGLIGRGTGLGDPILCGDDPDSWGPCGAGNQSYLDADVATLQADGFTQLTGTYSLEGTDTTGSATVFFTAAVPEPGTWMMMMLGFGMMGAGTRYRTRKAKLAYA